MYSEAVVAGKSNQELNEVYKVWHMALGEAQGGGKGWKGVREGRSGEREQVIMS